MKIGIVTYHRSHNYGAMLQAYALRRFLADCGHDVRFVDYWPEHQRAIYRFFSWRDFIQTGLRGKARMVRTILRSLPRHLLRRHKFNVFFKSAIRPYCEKPTESFDAIVYGSDQIWRKQLDGSGYNPIYFGNNDFHANRQISYAASMGQLPETDQEKAFVRDLLRNLSSISVRESDLQAFLTNFGLNRVELVADPVFLLSTEVWRQLAGKSQIESHPYLVFYDLLPSTRGQALAVSFANRFGLKVVRVSGRAECHPSKQSRTTEGPSEFLNLLKFANFIVTSSFHGLAFALIFHKPFLATFPFNNGRAKSLLASVGLLNRLVPADGFLGDPLDPIDWDHVDQSLTAMRISSGEWLLNNLQSDETARE